jgi:hypothetical protein
VELVKLANVPKLATPAAAPTTANDASNFVANGNLRPDMASVPPTSLVDFFISIPSFVFAEFGVGSRFGAAGRITATLCRGIPYEPRAPPRARTGDEIAPGGETPGIA